MEGRKKIKITYDIVSIYIALCFFKKKEYSTRINDKKCLNCVSRTQMNFYILSGTHRDLKNMILEPVVV